MTRGNWLAVGFLSAGYLLLAFSTGAGTVINVVLFPLGVFGLLRLARKVGAL